MKQCLKIELLFLGFFLAACQSINHNGAGRDFPSSQVVFTFDDGPNAQDNTTARLLDVLKKYEIKAMFSLLGENSECYPELVRRIHNEGHYIINHGYFDKWACRMGADEFRNNLARGEAAIITALGHNLYPKLYRPHGGLYNSKQEKIFREAGYLLVPNSIRVYDAVLTGAKRAKVVNKIIKTMETQRGGIILLHDGRGSHLGMEKELAKKPEGAFDRSWVPDAVEEIILALLNRGFILHSPDTLAVVGLY